jgi:hypothetical protein
MNCCCSLLTHFCLFPSHIKRIILCFVYSYDHHPYFIYPSLEEEDLHTACIVDVDSVSLPQPVHKDDNFIQISFEFDQPCNLEDIGDVSKPIHVSSTSSFIIDHSNQLVNPHDQPTSFKTRIIMKMFKPLRIPYHLNPYPLDFFEYIPRFLERIMSQMRDIWRPLKTLLISLK